MIGVRSAYQSRGLAGQILDAVHAMSENHPVSQGVTLTTGDSRKVSLYERFGYCTVGHFRLDAQLETWGFFRPGRTTEAR